MTESPSRANRLTNLFLILLIVLSMMSGAYYSLRYRGMIMEVDTSRLTVSADGILETGSINNIRQYNNGFGYTAQVAILSLVTGVDVNTLQLSSGVWIFVVILIAFIAFRELLGSPLGAGLAALLLLLQPDFLFYVVRGSHERNTWSYGLLMLFFLALSYRHAQQSRKLLVDIILFYLSYWGMTCSNVYFSSTYIAAIFASFLAFWVYQRVFRIKREDDSAWQSRVLLICLSCFTVVYLFIAYIYLPARYYFYLFTNLFDRVSMLVLGSQPDAQQMMLYSQFEVAWRSRAAYLAVTSFQWVVAAASFIIWAYLTFGRKRLDRNNHLVWQMYTGFGMLLAFGLVADLAGFQNQNLQLRMFTPFCIFSSALVAYGVVRLLPRLKARRARTLSFVPAALLVIALLAALVKITNDPVIGNQWLFYTPPDVAAGRWIDERMTNQHVWVDTGDHLREVFYFLEGYREVRPNTYEILTSYSNYPYVLISRVVQMRTARSGVSLPPVRDNLLIYDNGTARLYHARPVTPYQK